MDYPNIWKHNYALNGKAKNYNVELVNYQPAEEYPEDPSEFIKIRKELDKYIETFLDAYHTNPLIPMRIEIIGKAFQISMSENDLIIVEELHERRGIRDY